MLKLIKLWDHPKNSILLITLFIGIVVLFSESIITISTLSQLYWTNPYSTLAEFLSPQQRFLTIYEVLGFSGIEFEIIHTYWDFLFIIGYMLAFFSFFLLISRKAFKQVHKFSLWMSLTPLIAGIFHILKNIGLLVILNDYSIFTYSYPLILSISAALTLGFLLSGILYFSVIGITYLVVKIGNTAFPDKK